MEFEKAFKMFQDIPFFEDFSREEKRFLASMGPNLVTFQDTEVLIKEGDLNLHLFILLEGRVRVTKGTPPGTELSKLNPGAVFGEISLITKQPRKTNILAEGEATVLKMDGETLERLNPLLLNKIKNRLIALLVKRLDDMNDQMMKLVK